MGQDNRLAFGTIARIDLTCKKVCIENLDYEVVKKYIGGSGLGAYLFMKESSPGIAPFDSDNPIIFLTGPFTGTFVPTSGRNEIITRSPLTGIWGEADVGGRWGVALRRSGLDGIIVTGKASSPIYIYIENGKVEFKDAQYIWGKDVYEANDAIILETNKNTVISCIGPAGEKLVPMACIINDGADARAAGRCGLGAVMGSKNLKAIAVNSNIDKVPTKEPEILRDNVKEFVKTMREKMKGLSQYGTAGSIANVERVGDLPIKNWTMGSWVDGADKISGQSLRKANYVLSSFFCGSCPIGCGKKISIPDSDKYGPISGAGPEYESLAMLGAMTLVDDLNAVVKATDMCNRLGIDTISTGAAIAFAIEAFEKNIITNEDTGGLELSWGDPETLITLVDYIGNKKGIGEILGKGVKAAVEKFGGGSESFAIHVKGLEFPGHDPRAYNSVGLSYATSNRGACHVAALSHAFERSLTLEELGYDGVQDPVGVEGKGKFIAQLQNLMAVFDSLKLCKLSLFGGVKIKNAIDWYKMVTGIEMTIDDLMLCGERIYNLKRLYNVSCGISRKDDVLPERILSLKRGTGGAPTNLPPLQVMLEEYYDYRGWDKNGKPTLETIKRLGLEELMK